jgi:hypothetical protein
MAPSLRHTPNYGEFELGTLRPSLVNWSSKEYFYAQPIRRLPVRGEGQAHRRFLNFITLLPV